MRLTDRAYFYPLLLILIVTAALLYYGARELSLNSGVLGVPLDDAFIHMQFARNLSAGAGFSFNAGQPTPGSTSPLWTIALIPAALLFDSLLIPAVLMSAIFTAATVLLTFCFTRSLSSRAWVGLLAAVGVALTGRMLWAGLAGMETTAFAALSVAAVWLYHRRRLDWVSALAFALAAQLRPEGHLLFALVILDTGIRWRQGKLAEGGRQIAVGLVIYLLVALPYVLFSLSTTGRPLPNTFYAKSSAAILFSWRTLRETAALHWQDNVVGMLLLPFGLLPVWRRERLAVAWLVALWLVTPFIVDQVWHHGRYTIPLIPFQMIVAAHGVEWIYDQSLRRTSAARARILVLSLVVLLILAAGRRFDYWAGMLGYNSREIREVDQAIGLWLKENTSPDAVIAVDDIGAIGYLSERRILDLQGLVSPEVWPALAEDEGLARNQELARALSAWQPDYLAIFPNWHYELAVNEEILTPVERFWVDTHTILFDQEAMVYRPRWPYLEVAEPEQAVDRSFGNAVKLAGYDLEPARGSLKVILYWQSLSTLDRAYDVFVHLVDQEGRIVAQVDEQPLGGLAPTDRWQPGDIVRDPKLIELPADLPAGRYALQVGLFFREDGSRLALDGDAEEGALLLEELLLPHETPD